VSQNADFQISGAIQWDWARRFVKEILLQSKVGIGQKL
jgi:hypothetical protein